MKPLDSLGRRRNSPDKPSTSDGRPQWPSQPLAARRKDRHSRKRRDDRDDRSLHRLGEYHERRSPLGRERHLKRRRSPAALVNPYRERRQSPSLHTSKRSRRDQGVDDERRGSPCRGFGFDDRREGLMSYKQFIQELEDDILPADAERRYEEYRSEYISTQKRAYFDAHKEEKWLRDKYHPTNVVTVIERRNKNARALAKNFLLDLQSGTLNLGPCATASSSVESGHISALNFEDETETGRKHGRRDRGSADENDVLAVAPKAHLLSFDPRRIQQDIEQAQALLRKLDKEKALGENVLAGVDQDKPEGDGSYGAPMGPIVIIKGLTSVKRLDGVELLDTLITYLWRVHGMDYYGMSEINEPKGLLHVRPESRSHDEMVAGGSDWEKKLDSFWQVQLQREDPLEKMIAKEKIDAAAAEALAPYVRKVRYEKYGWKYDCQAKGCTKLFHAAEFAHKHLRLKHPDLVLELTSNMREDLYFENYMNDPDALGGTPVMLHSVMKGRLQRRLGGAAEGRNPDDLYGGQGDKMRAPFSDIRPPTVLMPVPGAGSVRNRLGPFLPGPSKVAMRMLREQRGPSLYDGNSDLWGGKDRSGLPGPIRAVNPALRQDPRSIRSYHDLDAPEDDVTVIDYRSL